MYLEPIDFQEKTIYALDITNNENLMYIGRETFQSLNASLQALVIRNSPFSLLEEQKRSFFDLFSELHNLKHLILEDNQNLSLEDVSRNYVGKPFLNNLEYLSFKGSHLYKIESALFWPLRDARKLTQLNLQSCNLGKILHTAVSFQLFILKSNSGTNISTRAYALVLILVPDFDFKINS